MSDIRRRVKKQYQIDLDEENILKLYRLDKLEEKELVALSDEELRAAFEKAEQQWKGSAQSTVDVVAQRAKKWLASAGAYHEILLPASNRRELFAHYQKTSEGAVEFARQFFAIVQTAKTRKRITKADVEFFYEFYRSEDFLKKENREAITKILGDEFKVQYDVEEETKAEEEKESKVQNSDRITNLFSKKLILSIQTCARKYEAVKASGKIPELRSLALAEYLKVPEMKTKEAARELIRSERERTNKLRDTRKEYTELVEIWNTMLEWIGTDERSIHPEVRDNFEEFKLLLSYPGLSSYLYSFEEVRKNTFEEMDKSVFDDYGFMNQNDFILRYFAPLYEHFNIQNDSAVRKLLKEAEKRANQNPMAKKAYELLSGMPLWVHGLYYFAYWPLFLFYLILEIGKGAVLLLSKSVIPIYVLVFVWLNFFWGGISSKFAVYNFRLWKVSWDEMLVLVGPTYLLLYGPLTYLIASAAYNGLIAIRKKTDYVGLERTCKKIFDALKVAAKKKYKKGGIIPQMLLPGVVNLVGAAIILFLLFKLR